MNTTKTGIIPLSVSLSTHAKNAHVFNGIHIALLKSFDQLCHDECIAILDSNEINIMKNKTHILRGHRNNTDDLWDIPISRLIRHRAHAILTRKKTKTELIQYLHGCYFISTPGTFPKAIKMETSSHGQASIINTG